MARFEGFLELINQVPRRKFHVLERVEAGILSEFENRYAPLPEDYREFVAQFGRAQLFRDTLNWWYRLYVYAPPRVFVDNDGVSLIRLGSYLNTGYLSLLWTGKEYVGNPTLYVGETRIRKFRKQTFTAWLFESMRQARRSYKPDVWKEVMTPVPPFNDEETRIVESIPLYDYRKVGVSPRGYILVEVKNRSSLRLDYITTGVKLGYGMEGKCGIRVADVLPGEVKIVEQPMYIGVTDPENMELFRIPLPDPEDRPYYSEFRTLEKTAGGEKIINVNFEQ